MAGSSPFSIIIPTWNNLTYLMLCVKSIRAHSSAPHQVVVHVNEGNDGTVEWLKAEKIEHTFSPENIGICRAFNKALALAKYPVVGYMNDDMYVLPKWDNEIMKSIPEHTGLWMTSATMIEPVGTRNPCVIVKDFGRSAGQFDENGLINFHHAASFKDWHGATWPPVFMTKKSWQLIGGFSEAFSPGMYSDPDISRKMWEAGCRYFKGVGSSRVYHFQRKSTGRIQQNDGRKLFIHKWGITPSAFYRYRLRMGRPFDEHLKENKKSLGMWLNKIRCKLIKLSA